MAPHRPSLGLSRLSPRAKPTQQRAIFNLLGTSGWNQVGPKSNSKAVGRGGATGGADHGAATHLVRNAPAHARDEDDAPAVPELGHLAARGLRSEQYAVDVDVHDL